MAKKEKKRTNKAKFSLYLDRDIMKEVAKRGQKQERSINYMVEKVLEREFITG